MPKHYNRGAVAYTTQAVKVASNRMQHDKQVQPVNLDLHLGTVQHASILPGGSACTFPQTATGFRWKINLYSDAGNEVGINWAIVAVRGSQTPSLAPFGSAGGGTVNFITGTAEREVIAWGSEIFLANATQPILIEGATKVGRKLQQGDDLWIIAAPSSAATNTKLVGTVQYFRKS